MKQFARRRPSPALVIASLALAVALTGTAIAGPAAINSISKPKVKKIAKVQAESVLGARESALNVNSAKTAGTAQSATSAQTADSTFAFAFVGAFGDVSSGRGISSSNVTWMPPGVYCIDLPFRPAGGHATPTSNSSAFIAGLSVAGSGFLVCPASAEVEVVRSDEDGDRANGEFHLSLYR
jgi:hypothetical protein